jgi:hypothetical protein
MSIPDQTTPGIRSFQPSHATREIGRRLEAFGNGPALPIATALLFAVVWGPRFARSFWVDEAGTFWMVHEGLIRAVQKTWQWPGQSILYSAIASLFCFDGAPLRDFLLRIPSLIGLAAASYFLYRIAERSIGDRAGMVAVILFLFHPGVAEIGFQARPYPLAMAAVTASCWALGEWVGSRRRSHLLWYILASVLVIHLHYFFAVILAVHALYLLFVFYVEGRRQRLGEAVLAGTAILLSIVPLIPHVQLMVRGRHAVPSFQPPALVDLTNFLAPSLLVAGLLVAGCLIPLARPAQPGGRMRLDPGFLFLVMAWWLVGPTLFMLVARATSTGTFLLRYIAFSFPAQALLFASIGYRLFGASRARVWALAAVALFAANPLLTARGKAGQDELLPLIRLIRAEGGAPVFFPSLVVESLFSDWRAGNQPDSHLFAPLVAYPIDNPLLPLPFKETEKAKEYVSEMLDSRLKRTSKVLFVDQFGDREQWVKDLMGRRGFHGTTRDLGSFTLYVFRR